MKIICRTISGLRKSKKWKIKTEALKEAEKEACEIVLNDDDLQELQAQVQKFTEQKVNHKKRAEYMYLSKKLQALKDEADSKVDLRHLSKGTLVKGHKHANYGGACIFSRDGQYVFAYPAQGKRLKGQGWVKLRPCDKKHLFEDHPLMRLRYEQFLDVHKNLRERAKRHSLKETE